MINDLEIQSSVVAAANGKDVNIEVPDGGL
jgi:hypothetical protein